MEMMRSTIWIFSIEPIETRYTAQWHNHIPNLLNKRLGDKFNIVQIDGVQKNTKPTPGAFLNFSDTNYWKSSQLCNWLDRYNYGEVTPDDQFLFTDGWNPSIIQLRYMNDLLSNNWKFHGLWHAGSWDSHDFLGRIIGDEPWVRYSELAMYNSFDHNYFATNFHIDIFAQTFAKGWGNTESWVNMQLGKSKIIKTGWPMEYMPATLSSYRNLPKRDLILFPHRIAPEKQVEIFRDLAKSLPQYEFIVCQDTTLSKHEYHTLLGESKMVFSASKQETLGISVCSEGPLLKSMPLSPDRLSYSELFSKNKEFLYPESWTLDYESYIKNKSELIQKISHMMGKYDTFMPQIQDYVKNSYKDYFESDRLISSLDNFSTV